MSRGDRLPGSSKWGLDRLLRQVTERQVKMKRLFNPRKRSEGEATVEAGNTLDRIVKDKEGVKKSMEQEEREFLNKKREAERKMIEFEKQV